MIRPHITYITLVLFFTVAIAKNSMEEPIRLLFLRKGRPEKRIVCAL